MLKLLKNVVAFIFIAGISSAVGQQISGGGSSGGGGNNTYPVTLSGNVSSAAWTTTGTGLIGAAANFTDTTSSGTVSAMYIHRLGIPTLLASAGTTYTKAYGLWVEPPTASTNVTVTTGFAAGFNGNVALPTGFLQVAGAGSAGTPAVQIFTDGRGFYAANGGAIFSMLTNGNSGWGNGGAGGFTMWSGTASQIHFGLGTSSTPDVYLFRAAAATLQLGATAVDTSAATVAQTLTTQPLLAGGTADQAGKDFTISVSPGKGTGAGGNLVLQTALAGSTGTVVNALTTGLILDSTSHVRVGATTAPALTSCGTSPAIAGTDLAGTVTMGTTATGCVITFNKAYGTAPFCTVSWRATPLASQSYTVSTTAITTTQTSTSNNLLDYVCHARTAG